MPSKLCKLVLVVSLRAITRTAPMMRILTPYLAWNGAAIANKVALWTVNRSRLLTEFRSMCLAKAAVASIGKATSVITGPAYPSHQMVDA